METILTFFKEHSISYELFEHEAVFTCEEAEKIRVDIPGAPTKNLFLTNKKKDVFFLVSVGHEKRVDLKELAKLLGQKRLSFASADFMQQLLGVQPGAVTLMGLMHDTDHKVQVVLDEALWHAEALQCHPLVNTATVVVSHEGLEAFLKATGHTPRVENIPSLS